MGRLGLALDLDIDLDINLDRFLLNGLRIRFLDLDLDFHDFLLGLALFLLLDFRRTMRFIVW